MRILVVAPKVTELAVLSLPLGLAYIAGQMKRDGHEVFWLNMNHHDEDMEALIGQKICLHDPDIIATGGMYLYMEFTRAAFVMARKTKPDILCLAGGTGLTAEPELFMNHTGANIGVIGEGEATVSELLKALSRDRKCDLSDIPGLIFKTDHSLFKTQPRVFARSIDDYPWPDLEGFNYRLAIERFQNISDFSVFAGSAVERPRMIPLITSRACPYACTFCFHSTGRKYTERSLDDVFSEIDHHVKKYDANFIIILDEVFCPDNKRLTEFCQRIKDYNVKWWSQSHVKMFDPKRVAMMRDAGCVGSSFGIESMDDHVLKSMKKHNIASTVNDTLQKTYEAGIDIQGNLIFGDAEETLESAEASLSWWEQNLHLGVNVTMLALYPRSEMYVQALEKGIIRDHSGFIKAGCPIVNASKMTDAEFKELRTRIDISNLIRYYAKCTHPVAEKDPEQGAETLYSFSARCPHCQAESHYQRVSIPFNSHKTFYMACRTCYRRFAPSTLRRAPEHEKANEKAQAALQAFESRNPKVAEDFCTEVLNKSPFHAKSLYAFSRILLNRGEKDRAFRSARLAGIYDPANPTYLEHLAETLPEGFVGRAKAVLKAHAAWLRNQGIDGVIYVKP